MVQYRLLEGNADTSQPAAALVCPFVYILSNTFLTNHCVYLLFADGQAWSRRSTAGEKDRLSFRRRCLLQVDHCSGGRHSWKWWWRTERWPAAIWLLQYPAPLLSLPSGRHSRPAARHWPGLQVPWEDTNGCLGQTVSSFYLCVFTEQQQACFLLFYCCSDAKHCKHCAPALSASFFVLFACSSKDLFCFHLWLAIFDSAT